MDESHPFPNATSRKHRRRSPALLALALALGLRSLAGAVTWQDFDLGGVGTEFPPRQTDNPPAAFVLDGGPTGRGRCLRLVSQGNPPNSNSVTFDQSDSGTPQVVVAEFDFRIQCGETRGDGFGFTLLRATEYPQGIVGTVAPDHTPYAAEEPGYTRSIGVGFDIFTNDGVSAREVTAGSTLIPEVQSYDRPHTPSYTLSFDGARSAVLPRTATAAQVQAALNALPTIVAAGRVTVATNQPGEFIITFTAAGARNDIVVGWLPTDLGHPGVRSRFSSSLSLHYDGLLLAQADTVPVTDLANGQWKRARITVRAERVTVELSATRGQWHTLLDRAVPGVRPYAARAHFGGRCGSASADIEIDNVSVAFLQAGQSAVSFATAATEVAEEAGEHLVTLRRAGDVSRAATVAFRTAPASATDDEDFTPTTGTVHFAAGKGSATLRIPILDDALTESTEDFTITLENPTGGAVLGTTTATVRILDDETARTKGRWSEPFGVGVSGVHAALLPTGRVLLFDRIGTLRVWDPATLASSTPPPPPGRANLFCSGHCYLPDGTLLIVGGHDDRQHDGHYTPPGAGEHDGKGLATAFRFQAAKQKWSALPEMKAGRWYPTTTVLADGSVLVVSGSVRKDGFTYIQNELPEVWTPGGKTWRELTHAEEQQISSPYPKPQGFDLYPRIFLAPDGRVLNVGADEPTWWLDTAGTGEWSEGPRRVQGMRTYGAAVSYAPGKILYVGGDNPPLASAEVIDLNAASPAWRLVDAMEEKRRQLNATTLPDGTVLVTGGSRNAGRDADGVADPVLAAELWDPGTEEWTTMAAMDIARLYHSTAMLLPDGRVLSTGGGHSGDATSFHNEAELYSPPYLFKGPRPTIASAPSVLTYGQRFLVQTPEAASIASACLIRLAAVTHSYNMNTLRVPLSFTPRERALVLATPGSGVVAPPGHYMLFLVNTAGVPSIARIVKVATDLPGGTFRGLISSSPASHEAAGLAQFVVNGQGSFTATIVFGGGSYTVRGAFDSDGEFATTLPGSTPVAVQFALATTSGGPFITGTLTRAGVTGAFSAERDFSPTHPAAPAGRYTVWLPNPNATGVPAGHGYGAMTVSSEGHARLAFRVGDDTAASYGSPLPRGGAWPILVALYGGAGSISGALTFRDVPGVSHVDGPLAWFRTGAFATEIELRGSRYVAPPAGVRVLDFAATRPNGVFQIAGGNLAPTPPDKSVTLDTRNRVLFEGSEPFTFTLTPASGLFTGTFQDPATQKRHTFRGAVIQAANLGAGLFDGNSATGSIELRPIP